MQLTIIHTPSDHSTPNDGGSLTAAALRDLALGLIPHGIDVVWVSSEATAAAFANEAELVAQGIDGLPPTCRYVIPCQAYRLGPIKLLCVDHPTWTDKALHTRFFTFLCLLQRAWPSAAWQTWNEATTAFVAVYTARYLELPVVVGYHQRPAVDYTSEWIARHASRLIVRSESIRQGVGEAAQERVEVLDLEARDAMKAMVDILQGLR